MRFHLKLANSVYARMFFVLCIVAVPTVIGLCVYAYYERNQNLADSRATAQHYVNMVARHESWLIKSYEQTLSAIAAAPAIDDREIGRANVCNPVTNAHTEL